MYGNWEDYTLGPDDSLKNINDILTRIGYTQAFEFVNEIFEEIAAHLLNCGRDDCRKEYRQKITAFFNRHLQSKEINHLLLLLIYHRACQEWEDTLRHDPVHFFLDAVESYQQTTLPSRTPTEQYVISLFLALFRILSSGMRIENSLNINCPLGTLKHSTEVAKVSPKTPDGLAFDADEETIIAWALREIDDSKTYFASIARISEAVLTWLAEEPGWSTTVAEVAEHTLNACRTLKEKSYFYATELDAHHTTLQQILHFGDVNQTEVEHFTVVYCFPFVIRKLAPKNASELDRQAKRIFEKWRSWSDHRPKSDAFSHAFKPTSLEQVELTDVWAIPSEVPHTDREKQNGAAHGARLSDTTRPQKCYGLQAINFPDVVIHDVENLDKQIILRCEVRLSLFGNHYLRFSATAALSQGDDEDNDYIGYREINAHDVHRSLRRTSSLCGKEPISSKSGQYENFSREPDGAYRPESNLQDIARRLVQSLDEVLSDDGMSVEEDLAKTSKAIFSLAEFGGSQTTPDKREWALQRLFMNPIGGPADRLEPWLNRTANPRTVKNLAKTELGDRAEIYTTANTTLVRLPSHAHFVWLDYQDMAEFVSTLEPLYISWNAQVSSKMEEVIDDLEGWDADRSKIEKSRIELQQVVVSAQKAMLDIESPSIVTNSVYRSYLDAFIKQSTLNTLKKNFHDLTKNTQDVVHTVSNILQEQERKETEQRRYREQKEAEHQHQKAERLRYLVTLLLAIMGVIVSLGQLTEYKVHCIENHTPGTCLFHSSKASATTVDSPNSAADQNQPVKTAQ